MPTGTYPIDATNNLEPIDSRYVADFPAELRAMKTRMNSAISSIGALTGALMADGTNYMTGKLGVGGTASAGLMFHLYGNAKMEGTVTVIGKQNITGSSFAPSNSTVSNAASTVRGSYGGGYLMVDGATYGGSYMQAGELKIGLGTAAGLQSKLTIGQSFHSFEDAAFCQVNAYAGNGHAGFSAVASGTNSAYLFLGNSGGEKSRISSDNNSTLAFYVGASVATALTVNINRDIATYGAELNIGAGSSGEKRMRLHNEYGSPYFFLSTGGELGFFDPVTDAIRTQFSPNGDAQVAGNQLVGSTGAAVNREMRLRNSNRQVALVLEGGGAAAHLWDVTGNNALWTSNMAGDFTARGNVTAYSDARLKHDVRTFDSALDTVQKMRGVRYSWNRDGSAGIGFIAQELEQVCPELVLTGELKSVAYGNIAAILVEAVKELRAEVNSLRAELALHKSGG